MCSAAATALIVLMRGNCDVFEVHRHEITAPRWGSGAPRLRSRCWRISMSADARKTCCGLNGSSKPPTPKPRPDPVARRFRRRHLPAHSAPPEEIAARLGRLNAKLGVYAVLGNHDHWQQPQRIEAALAANGIGLLENRSVRLEADGKPFHLVRRH